MAEAQRVADFVHCDTCETVADDRQGHASIWARHCKKSHRSCKIALHVIIWAVATS